MRQCLQQNNKLCLSTQQTYLLSYFLDAASFMSLFNHQKSPVESSLVVDLSYPPCALRFTPQAKTVDISKHEDRCLMARSALGGGSSEGDLPIDEGQHEAGL